MCRVSFWICEVSRKQDGAPEWPVVARMSESFVMPSVGILIHCSGGGQLGSEWKCQMSVKLRGNDSHTLTLSQ